MYNMMNVLLSRECAKVHSVKYKERRHKVTSAIHLKGSSTNALRLYCSDVARLWEWCLVDQTWRQCVSAPGPNRCRVLGSHLQKTRVEMKWYQQDASSEKGVSIFCQTSFKSACYSGSERLFDHRSVFMITEALLKVFSHLDWVQAWHPKNNHEKSLSFRHMCFKPVQPEHDFAPG